MTTKICTRSTNAVKRTKSMLAKNAYQQSQLARKVGVIRSDQQQAKRKLAESNEQINKLQTLRRYEMNKVAKDFGAKLKAVRLMRAKSMRVIKREDRDMAILNKKNEKLVKKSESWTRMLKSQEAKASKKCAARPAPKKKSRKRSPKKK